MSQGVRIQRWGLAYLGHFLNFNFPLGSYFPTGFFISHKVSHFSPPRSTDAGCRRISREHPDMMLASEGGGESWKSGHWRRLHEFYSTYQFQLWTRGEGSKNPKIGRMSWRLPYSIQWREKRETCFYASWFCAWCIVWMRLQLEAKRGSSL